MKVADYIKRYNELLVSLPKEEEYKNIEPLMITAAAAITIACDMIDEINIIGKKRGMTGGSVLGIIKEQDAKWKSFARQVNITAIPQVDKYFLEVLQSEIPAAKEILDAEKVLIQSRRTQRY